MTEIVKKQNCLDYISLSCSESGILKNYYMNNVKSNDDSALDYLESVRELRFLADGRNILFHSAKDSIGINVSYEYKLKNHLENTIYKKIFNLWKDHDSAELIKILSSKKEKGDFINEGIYWVGFEFPNERETIFDNAIQKIYFSTRYMNDIGDCVYDDFFFIDRIRESGLNEFSFLSNEAHNYIALGFHLYMLAWNWDKLKNISKYKMYFIIADEIDAERFINQVEIYTSCKELSEKYYDILKNQNLYFQGIALCLDTKYSKTVNVYFKCKD